MEMCVFDTPFAAGAVGFWAGLGVFWKGCNPPRWATCTVDRHAILVAKCFHDWKIHPFFLKANKSYLGYSFTWVEMKSLGGVFSWCLHSFFSTWLKEAKEDVLLLPFWRPGCLTDDSLHVGSCALCSLAKIPSSTHHAGSNDIRWKDTFNETNRFQQMFHDKCFCLERIYVNFWGPQSTCFFVCLWDLYMKGALNACLFLYRSQKAVTTANCQRRRLSAPKM